MRNIALVQQNGQLPGRKMLFPERRYIPDEELKLDLAPLWYTLVKLTYVCTFPVKSVAPLFSSTMIFTNLPFRVQQ